VVSVNHHHPEAKPEEKKTEEKKVDEKKS